MAVPSYTTDLATFDLAEDTGSWMEFTGMALGGNPAEDDQDNEIQGLYMTSQTANTTGLISVGKIATGVSLGTNEVFLVWHQLSSPGAMDTYANGGLRLVVGTDAGNWKAWAIGGRLVPPNPYGGWQNNPIDPTVSYDYSLGTPPTSTYAAVGSACNLLTPIFKGSPHQCDAIRYGRAEARINGGETADYATFAGFAAINDANDAVDGYNRWGLLQEVLGGKLWKGLFTLGYTSAVDFRDANVNIFVQDTRKVLSGFNKIEVRQATSRVDWTGINITALGTVSKGAFEAIDDATINIISCTFTDMSTFIFQSNSTVLSSIFRRCAQVTAGGGTFTGCTFEEITDAVSILCSTTSNIEGCTFISDGSNHAIKIDTPGTYDLDDNVFTGYAVIDGSGGNEVIFNDSGGLVTLNASGNTGVLSVRNGTSATTDLNEDLITFKLTGLPSNTEVTIVNASTRAELFHIENSSGDVTHTYTTGGTVVDVLIHHVDYDPHIGTLLDYTLPSVSTTLPINLIVDNTYSNPT